MRLAITFLLLASCCGAQITINLQNGPPYTRHFAVHAVNDDPQAVTSAQIFSVNKELAEQGNKSAAYQLGLAYLQGEGVAQDLKAAEHWLEVGAKEYVEIQTVAEFYANGEYLAKDLDKEDRWYRAAGRPGDLFALARDLQTAPQPRLAEATQLYRSLLPLKAPEARRAQMELGNLVLNRRYSAGDTPEDHASNLLWARTITQELLGQEEYNIAVAYSAEVGGVPHDQAMWLRFCKRAAAYNIDLAQRFYAEDVLHGNAPRTLPVEGYAWLRLASEKQTGLRSSVRDLAAHLSPDALQEAQSLLDGLIATRERDGAYYPADDVLREPSAATLKAMPDDDPDVQLRRAFLLERKGSAADYEVALGLYRNVRDRRAEDIRFVLGREYFNAADRAKENAQLAEHWLSIAAAEGSHPAAAMLARFYRGEGGGKRDPVQASAWALASGAPGAAATSGLSRAQREAARKLYQAWITAHPHWVQGK